MADAMITPRGALTAQIAALPVVAGAALVVRELTDRGIATVMARAGCEATLTERAATMFRAEPPRGPRYVAAGATAFVGTGPGVWMMIAEAASPSWAASVAAALQDLAAISDQSSGYTILRVTGTAARDLLARGAFIDFHPSGFSAGDAAVTSIAHIGVILWQVDEKPTYDIACFRSFAASFWHWLEASAAGLGVAPTRAG